MALRLSIFLCFLAVAARGATPSYQNFDTNQFTTSNYMIRVKVPFVEAGTNIVITTNGPVATISSALDSNAIISMIYSQPAGVLLPGDNIRFDFDGTNTTVNGLLDGRALTNNDSRFITLPSGAQVQTFLYSQGPAYFANQVYFGWGLESYFDTGGSLLGAFDGSFTIGTSGAQRPASVFARDLLQAPQIIAGTSFVGNLSEATNLPLSGINAEAGSPDLVLGFTEGVGVDWVPKPALTGAVDFATSSNLAIAVFNQKLPYIPQYGSETLTNVDDIWPTLTYIADWGILPTSAKQDAGVWLDEWGDIDPAGKMNSFFLHHLTNWIITPTNVLADIHLNRLGQSGALVGQYPQWNGTNWVPADVLAGGTNATGVDRATVTNIARALDTFPTNAPWILAKLDSTPQLLSLATTWRSNLVTWTPQLDLWSSIWASNKQDRLPFTPIASNDNLGNWRNTPITSKQDTFLNKNANTFFAGPAGGGPGLPDFRTMAEADLPLQLPSSRLYGLLPNAVLPGTLYYWSLIGTSSKQDAFGSQSAKTFYAGPISGASAAPGFRAIETPDLSPALNGASSTNFSVNNLEAGEYAFSIFDRANASGSAGLVFDAGTPSATSTKFKLDGSGADLMNGAVLNGGNAQTASRVAVWDGSTNLTSSTVTQAELEGLPARVTTLEGKSVNVWTGTGLSANGVPQLVASIPVPNLTAVDGRLSFAAAHNAGSSSYTFGAQNARVYGARHDAGSTSYTYSADSTEDVINWTFNVVVNGTNKNLDITAAKSGGGTFNVKVMGYISQVTAP